MPCLQNSEEKYPYFLDPTFRVASRSYIRISAYEDSRRSCGLAVPVLYPMEFHGAKHVKFSTKTSWDVRYSMEFSCHVGIHMKTRWRLNGKPFEIFHRIPFHMEFHRDFMESFTCFRIHEIPQGIKPELIFCRIAKKSVQF